MIIYNKNSDWRKLLSLGVKWGKIGVMNIMNLYYRFYGQECDFDKF